MRFIRSATALVLAGTTTSHRCPNAPAFSAQRSFVLLNMATSSTPSSRKDLIRKLLKGIETGDPAAAAVVSEEKYIQHNPQTYEGGEGLAALFQRLSKSNPRVNIVRAFEDGDYVFAHTEYDFATRRIGFEVFRFEKNLAIEHWDNIQPRKGPNPSGHSMVDGPTEVKDSELTEVNRQLVRDYVNTVLVQNQIDKLADYVNAESFTQHSPTGMDGIAALKASLNDGEDAAPKYSQIHRVLAEGNFVLVASEGSLQGVHTSFYDLFRISNGKIVEHWDTVETIPPRSEWKNNNGKF